MMIMLMEIMMNKIMMLVVDIATLMTMRMVMMMLPKKSRCSPTSDGTTMEIVTGTHVFGRLSKHTGRHSQEI